jgi:Fe2+ or Zn2+ uptake regulation protein
MDARHPDEVARLIERAEKFWRGRRQRPTPVRLVVARNAFLNTRPFDAEHLLARARGEDRAISLASVYRVLADLVAADLLRALTGGAGERHHYVVADTPASGLSHLVCADCSEVLSIPDPCLPLREGALARSQGFTPRVIHLRVEATCDRLHATGGCPRKTPQTLRKDG